MLKLFQSQIFFPFIVFSQSLYKMELTEQGGLSFHFSCWKGKEKPLAFVKQDFSFVHKQLLNTDMDTYILVIMQSSSWDKLRLPSPHAVLSICFQGMRF